MTDPTVDLIRRQSMEALARANHVRRESSKLKHEIRAMKRPGAAWVAELLLNNHEDPAIGSMRVYGLLRAVWYLRHSKADRMLYLCDIPQHKRVRQLTERQRLALATRLRDWAAERPL